jgi:hypothetical protein
VFIWLDSFGEGCCEYRLMCQWGCIWAKRVTWPHQGVPHTPSEVPHQGVPHGEIYRPHHAKVEVRKAAISHLEQITCGSDRRGR